MTEPPVCTPPEDQKDVQPSAVAYPQGQPAAYPQGQPAGYPQGQPAAYPQGQPVVYQQGQAFAYPQGQPGAYPQGQPVAYPQGQLAAYYPQGQPVACAPGQPVVYQQGQPGVYQPGQQVVIAQPVNAIHVYHTGSNQGSCFGGTTIAEHYNERAGFATGVVHLVIAFLSIILGGAAYAFPVRFEVGYAIWSAIIFYIPTGILGIASKNKNSWVVIAYMVFAILTAFLAIGMFSYETFVAAVVSYFSSCYNQYLDYGIMILGCVHYPGAIAVHSLLALLGLVEFIVAIVSAVYCCRGSACCCAPPPTNQGVVTTTTTTMQYGQPQAQPMAVVASPHGNYPTGPASQTKP